MSSLIFNLYKILFLTVFISFFSQGSFSEVIFSEEDPIDEIDFLSAMKGFERDSEFIDQESTYTDTDYIKNYESGDEKMFALLAAQSGVLDETVKKINELMAKIEKDDLVMALGRSPTIFMMMLGIIHPQQPQAILPFSGTPDVINIRKGTDVNNDNRRNIVTAENLAAFKYILSQHLDNLKGRLFIVDHVGTGTSLNSFLRILRKLYPDILAKTNLIEFGLNPDKKVTVTENIGGKSTSIFQYGPRSKKLSLAGIPSIGTRPLVIDTIALHFSPRALLIYDNKMMKYFASPFGPFPACSWNFKYIANNLEGPEKIFKNRSNFIKNIIKQFYQLSRQKNESIGRLSSSYKQSDTSFLLTTGFEQQCWQIAEPYYRLQGYLPW